MKFMLNPDYIPPENMESEFDTPPVADNNDENKENESNE